MIPVTHRSSGQPVLKLYHWVLHTEGPDRPEAVRFAKEGEDVRGLKAPCGEVADAPNGDIDYHFNIAPR
jgi:hypothetical protein